MAVVMIEGGDPGVEYRTLDEFPEYAVGSDGSVWSKWHRAGTGKWRLGDWRRMKASKMTIGYLQARLRRGGKYHSFTVHRLVLTAFVGAPKPGEYGLHGDGDRTNNHLSNLRWGTAEDNSDDAKRHGTIAVGERLPHSAATQEIALKIRELAATGEFTQSEIGKACGVSRGCVKDIVRGRSWKHLGPMPQCKRHGPLRGSKNINAKITEAEAAQIKELLRNGETGVDIARRFGISESIVRRIKHNRTWSHVA